MLLPSCCLFLFVEFFILSWLNNDFDICSVITLKNTDLKNFGIHTYISLKDIKPMNGDDFILYIFFGIFFCLQFITLMLDIVNVLKYSTSKTIYTESFHS